MYFERKRLRELYNRVDAESMEESTFEAYKEELVSALGKSQVVQNFFFVKDDKHFAMKVDPSSITLRRQQPFLYSLSFEGTDDFEAWSVEGGFLCSEGRVRVWFLRQYVYAENAIRQGMQEYTIFEGSRLSIKSHSGKWYGKDEDSDPHFRGTWTLLMKAVGPTNSLEDIKPE
ncbi:unnamed protein product [Sphagnum balticum]